VKESNTISFPPAIPHRDYSPYYTVGEVAYKYGVLFTFLSIFFHEIRAPQDCEYEDYDLMECDPV
jgi:hypothetical protein